MLKWISIAILLLSTDLLFAGSFSKTPYSMNRAIKFKLEFAAEIDPADQKLFQEKLVTLGFEALPVGAVKPFGVSYDEAFVDRKRQVVVITNKYTVETTSNRLYSQDLNYIFYSNRNSKGLPLSIFVLNTSHHEAVKIISALLEVKKFSGLNKFLDLIPKAHADELATATSSVQTPVLSEKIRAIAISEFESLKKVENYQRSFAGCARGYYDLWETLWARPVRTVATIAIHPLDSADAMKKEALGYWEGGAQMVKDFFVSGYKSIKDFPNWPMEKKSAFYCQLGAPSVAKAYFPKATLGSIQVLNEEMIKVASRGAEATKPFKISAAQLKDVGIPDELAVRLAKDPKMAETYLRLREQGGVGNPFMIDEGYAGRMPTSSYGTHIGTQKVILMSDGTIYVRWHAEAFYSSSETMAARAQDAVQLAVAETRRITGNASYTPQKLWVSGPSKNLPGAEHWPRTSHGTVAVRLAGSTEDAVFLRSIQELMYRADSRRPSPVLLRPELEP